MTSGMPWPMENSMKTMQTEPGEQQRCQTCGHVRFLHKTLGGECEACNSPEIQMQNRCPGFKDDPTVPIDRKCPGFKPKGADDENA